MAFTKLDLPEDELDFLCRRFIVFTKTSGNTKITIQTDLGEVEFSLETQKM